MHPDNLAEDDWVYYRHHLLDTEQVAKRIGRIIDTDPLRVVPPGGNEALAVTVAPGDLLNVWEPERMYPESGRGEIGEPIEPSRN